jgi:hypothetical protein
MILLISQGERLVCVAPFYTQPARYSFEFSVWRILSLKAQTLRVFGESILMSSEVDPALCISAIADFLQNSCLSVDYLQVYGMNFSDRFWHSAMKEDGLSRRCGWKWFIMRQETTRQLRLSPSLDDYLAGLSSESRRMVRRHRRKFFSEPTARLEQISESRDVGRLLEWIDRVNSDSWQAKTFGGEKENTAARKHLLEKVAAQDWLRSYVLLLGDEPVAYKHNYQYRGTMFSQGNLSPGVVLTFCIVDEIHTDKGVDVWDFGFGDLPYKRTFCNELYPSAVVYFVPRGRWRLLLRLQLTANSLYERVRAVVVRLRIDKYIRKLLKRQQ